MKSGKMILSCQSMILVIFAELGANKMLFRFKSGCRRMGEVWSGFVGTNEGASFRNFERSEVYSDGSISEVVGSRNVLRGRGFACCNIQAVSRRAADVKQSLGESPVTMVRWFSSYRNSQSQLTGTTIDLSFISIAVPELPCRNRTDAVIL